MPTIKPYYRCEWCRRKIGDPNLKHKTHYCSDLCEVLHTGMRRDRKRRRKEERIRPLKANPSVS